MNEDALGELYRRTLAAAPEAKSACPTPETLLSIAEQAAGESCARHLEHVSGCADCQRELALLAQVRHVGPRPRRSGGWPRRRPPFWSSWAAARS